MRTQLTHEHLFCYHTTTMSIWHKLLYWLGLRRDPGPRYFEVSPNLHDSLSTLADQVSRPREELASDQMKIKIDSPEGRRIYARRLGVVEPVFANICVHKRMHRFTLRSKSKVDVQWILYTMVHNIGKIWVFGALH